MFPCFSLFESVFLKKKMVKVAAKASKAKPTSWSVIPSVRLQAMSKQTAKMRTKPQGSGRPSQNLSRDEKLAKKRDAYRQSKEKRGERSSKELPEALREHQFNKIYRKTQSGYEVIDEDRRRKFLESKQPQMSAGQYRDLLRDQADFQIEHKDFFNRKASGLGALPLYRTPGEDTVGNYQLMPYCGLSTTGEDGQEVFYYPHVKVIIEDDKKKVTKKVTCRKKLVRHKDERGKMVAKPSGKITGGNKRTVQYILEGFQGYPVKKSSDKVNASVERLVELARDKTSNPPSEASLRPIRLERLMRFVSQFFNMSMEDAKREYDKNKPKLIELIINHWENRDPDVVVKQRRRPSTGKRKRSPSPKKNLNIKEIPPEVFSIRILRDALNTTDRKVIPSFEQMENLTYTKLNPVAEEFWPGYARPKDPDGLRNFIINRWDDRVIPAPQQKKQRKKRS